MEWKESDLKHLQFLSNQIVEANFNVKGAELSSLIQSLQWLVNLRDAIKIKLSEPPKMKKDPIKKSKKDEPKEEVKS
jgi:hypothetical protein